VGAATALLAKHYQDTTRTCMEAGLVVPADTRAAA